MSPDNQAGVDEQWAAVMGFDYSRWKFTTVYFDDVNVLEVGGKSPKFMSKTLKPPELDASRVLSEKDWHESMPNVPSYKVCSVLLWFCYVF
jgi:hypothetical protein